MKYLCHYSWEPNAQKQADAIRADLLAQGIVLEDRPGGTTEWRRA